MFGTRPLRTVFAAGAIALTALTAACGSSSSGGSAGGSDDAGSGGLQGKTIALVGYGAASPWGAAFNKKFDELLAPTGAKVVDLTTMDAGTQTQNFNQAIAEKPDLIVSALLDTKAMVVPIEKAKQAGVPVLLFDAAPDPSVADDVMGVYSDNKTLGEAAAQNIVEGLKAQGKTSGNVIVLEGTASMLVTQDRMTGFNEVMSQNPGYKVIETQDTNWDPTLSGQVAQQLFAKYGCDGIDAAYGMADYMAVPIVQAAKQAGCKLGGDDGIIITGGNCFKAGIQAIKAGDMYGTATEDPITLANQTFQYIQQYFGGENPPRTELVKEDRVTKANLSQYEEQCTQA